MATWPAKVLLFGEYTVLLKGEALALPLSKWNGSWSTSDQVDDGLIRWANWLVRQEKSGLLPWSIRTADFLRFVERGGRFHSSIPTGCGLGSSGALVAALAESYSLQIPQDLATRLKGLAALEKYFHGNSSGMDPLVSLERTAIHRESDSMVSALQIKSIPNGLFLVETGIPRQTAPLVEAFHLLLEQEAERHFLLMDLLPQVHRAIHALIHGEMIPFQDAFAAISRMQGLLFQAMIPETLKTHWHGPDHYLKLCGAGGGGFFLGYAPKGTYPQLPFPIYPLDTQL